MPKPLDRLRNHLRALDLDGLVVPRFDAHQGEYIAPHDERLRYLTGFSGSAGIALILTDRAILFVDGRYQVQVRQEVDLGLFEIEHFYDNPIERWIADNLPAGSRIGFDPMLVPVDLHRRLDGAIAVRQGHLVVLADNPVDAVWADQPDPPLGPVSALPVSFAGETAADKRRRIAGELAASGTDILVETQPDNIAWLLNVRGADVPTVSASQGFALLHADGALDWFVDDRKLPNDREVFELDTVAIHSPAAFLDTLRASAAGKSIRMDPRFCSVAAAFAVEDGGGRAIFGDSPVMIAKAVKNTTEREGFRLAHIEDGVAVTQFLAWLEAEVPVRQVEGNPVTELEAEDRLLQFRSEGTEFVGPSFRAISAAGANAAMCHYAATGASNAPILTPSLYLIDSGGHYRTGTTDITRTLCLGEPGAEVRKAYTAVLKGFVALMTARFPAGTTPHQLDALARRPLWDLGLDYDHGTGHGVGHYLSIHEHPHRFGKMANPYPLAEGVIMTIEPGYYHAGGFGMRIENQVETVAAGPGFLAFRTLTFAPIDLRPVDLDDLTRTEKLFLNAYHIQVRSMLQPRLAGAALDWMIQQTHPIPL